jgi:vacuolar-type H+-ATPase subunit I/STV1
LVLIRSREISVFFDYVSKISFLPLPVDKSQRTKKFSSRTKHMDKQTIKDSCLEKISAQIAELQALINEVQSASNNETKSTAGDKHDTARAQAQIEVERLNKQLAIIYQMQGDLNKLSTEKFDKIQLGSFVKTSAGNFYVSVALGKMQYEDLEFFAISISSPLFLKLKGKTEGDEFEMINGNTVMIGQVY